MDSGAETNLDIDKDAIHKPKEEKGDIDNLSEQNASKRVNASKSLSLKKPRESDKHKTKSSTCNRLTYQRKYFWPPAPPKRKAAPVGSYHISKPSAEIILQERKVEIKDLESQVVYLQSQIKELKAENRTLLDVQTRQSKELKKYSGGITDIPALIRSHNDEIKAIQSNANAVRKELRVCQSDLKSKSELLLKKDQELNKLKHALKVSEQNVEEIAVESKKLNHENKKLEDEIKKLLSENEELNSKTEKMQKTIEQLTNEKLKLDETLFTTEHIKNHLKDNLKELQCKYDETLKNEIFFKKSFEAPKVMSSTQTEKAETAHVAIMTLEISKELELLSSKKVSIGVQTLQDQIFPKSTSIESRENEILENNREDDERCYSAGSKDQFTAFDAYPDVFSINNKPSSKAERTGFRKPLYSLTHAISKEASEVKKSHRETKQLPSVDMLKRPLSSIFDKKFIPLSNSLHNNTTMTCIKDPFSKSDPLIDPSLKRDLSAKKDDDLGFYLKESTSKNIFRKSSNRIQSSLEYRMTGRKETLSDAGTRPLDISGDTSLNSFNSNRSRDDLFSNLAAKQNTKYPNG